MGLVATGSLWSVLAKTARIELHRDVLVLGRAWNSSSAIEGPSKDVFTAPYPPTILDADIFEGSIYSVRRVAQEARTMNQADHKSYFEDLHNGLLQAAAADGNLQSAHRLRTEIVQANIRIFHNLVYAGALMHFLQKAQSHHMLQVLSDWLPFLPEMRPWRQHYHDVALTEIMVRVASIFVERMQDNLADLTSLSILLVQSGHSEVVRGRLLPLVVRRFSKSGSEKFSLTLLTHIHSHAQKRGATSLQVQTQKRLWRDRFCRDLALSGNLISAIHHLRLAYRAGTPVSGTTLRVLEDGIVRRRRSSLFSWLHKIRSTYSAQLAPKKPDILVSRRVLHSRLSPANVDTRILTLVRSQRFLAAGELAIRMRRQAFPVSQHTIAELVRNLLAGARVGYSKHRASMLRLVYKLRAMQLAYADRIGSHMSAHPLVPSSIDEPTGHQDNQAASISKEPSSLRLARHMIQSTARHQGHQLEESRKQIFASSFEYPKLGWATAELLVQKQRGSSIGVLNAFRDYFVVRDSVDNLLEQSLRSLRPTSLQEHYEPIVGKRLEPWQRVLPSKFAYYILWTTLVRNSYRFRVPRSHPLGLENLCRVFLAQQTPVEGQDRLPWEYDQSHFDIFISAYARHMGDGSGALNILQTMHRLGIPPTVFSWTILSSRIAKKRPAWAFDVLRRLHESNMKTRQAGVAPGQQEHTGIRVPAATNASYASVIRACFMRGSYIIARKAELLLLESGYVRGSDLKVDAVLEMLDSERRYRKLTLKRVFVTPSDLDWVAKYHSLTRNDKSVPLLTLYQKKDHRRNVPGTSVEQSTWHRWHSRSQRRRRRQQLQLAGMCRSRRHLGVKKKDASTTEIRIARQGAQMDGVLLGLTATATAS